MQLTLNFESGLVDAFVTCREFVQARSYQQGRSQKSIAADMDLSPSHLSRKLSHSGSMRFTLDDFEKFLKCTGERERLFYLFSKYLYDDTDEEFKKQIAGLERRLQDRQVRAVK